MNNAMRNLMVVVFSAGILVWSMTLGVPGTNVTSAVLASADSLGPTISPDMGGRATIFNISSEYGGFGKPKGKVLVGGYACQVGSWSDINIRATIVADLEVGVYDVRILRVNGQAIVIPDGFEVVSPGIVSSGPIDVTPGSVYDISTINLTPIEGNAFISVVGGALIQCPIIQWTPVMVRIEIPSVPPGEYSLLLTTRQGNLTAQDLFQVRGFGANWDYSWTGNFSITATGIMYGGKVCRFAPKGYPSPEIWYDISDKPEDNGNQGRVMESNGVIPYTYGQVMPAVIGDRLYLFWTSLAGDYFCYTWTDNVAVPKPVWAPRGIIALSGGAAGIRPNVLYDPQSKAVYIYYQTTIQSSYGGWSIGIVWTTDINKVSVSWSFEWLRFSESNGIVSSMDSPSVTVNTRGEIMLARKMGNDLHVTKSKDPFHSSSDSVVIFHYGLCTAAPWIQAMGQGQVALIWRDGESHPNIAVYTDDLDKWDDHEEYFTSNTYRNPTLMPVVSKYTDDPVKGTGIELRLWFFFWNNENSYGRFDRYLGELRQVKTEDQDWNTLADQMGYTGEDAVLMQRNIAEVCPLVGIVDIPPPCALNGKTSSQNNSSFTFAFKTEKTQGVQMTWKVGAFVTGGSGIYACADIHAGVQQSFSNITTTSSRTSYTYKPSYPPGKISAIHAVPVTRAMLFQAYRDKVKVANVPPIVVLQVLRNSLIEITVNPSYDKRMPHHTAGDLLSYNATTAGYDYDSNTGSWTSGSGATEVAMGQHTAVSSTNGFYLSVKAGGQIPAVISFGLEGSFTWDRVDETTTSNDWILVLNNPVATRSGDVQSFWATLYLLYASKNPYWIPSYVTQGGDAAWFVTYNVTKIQYK